MGEKVTPHEGAYSAYAHHPAEILLIPARCAVTASTLLSQRPPLRGGTGARAHGVYAGCSCSLTLSRCRDRWSVRLHQPGPQNAKSNWPWWIRTTINGSKVRCPAVGRRASGVKPSGPAGAAKGTWLSYKCLAPGHRADANSSSTGSYNSAGQGHCPRMSSMAPTTKAHAPNSPERPLQWLMPCSFR
jgi:hypothetical protein